MAKSPDRNHKDDKGKYSDDYFAKQWSELQDKEKQRGEDFRRWWLEWQKRNQERAPYSAWLVVPAALTDYGVRPLTSGMPYWASPFIGVTSPDPSGNPLAGAPNTVWTRVFNLGAATSAPTMLRYYWADPSVGLGAADAHPIGQVMVEVPPMSSVVVNCPTPWVPTYLNGGHECLFVSADNVLLDPIQAPFQPWADRHVGQRNMNVLPALAQAMQLWLPGGIGAMEAQLRVLALRVRVPRLPLKTTAVETISQVADHVLSGFGPLTRKGEAAGRLRFAAKRIDPGEVIAGMRLTEEQRPVRDREKLSGPQAGEPHAWGDVLLRLQTIPMAHQQVRIEFRPLDLAGDEFVVLHFAWIAGGMILGGYATTLAHPGWFKPGSLHPPETGDHMSISAGKHDLRDLVIRHNPHAHATLEIAQQLERHLPIYSAKQLRDGVKVGDAHLPGELIEQIAAGLFPIRDEEELVTRVAAMLRIFAAYGGANRGSLNAATTLLLDRLEGHGDRPSMQVLVARGKPLLPLPPEKKEA